MRVYEQYIIGMLTNLVNLPLSRIHNMIRMFVPSDDKDLSEAELQRFLSRMVEDGKIEVSAGMYKLRAHGHPRPRCGLYTSNDAKYTPTPTMSAGRGTNL